MSQGLTRSVQRELNSFFSKIQDTEYSILEVTDSALSHARKKLKPEAFKELNKEAIRTFYAEAPWIQWLGHRLLSIDGSTLVLPKHPSVREEFGVHGFGSKADSQNSIGRASMLYDVLNLTTLDAQLDKYASSERSLLDKHLDATNFLPNDLLLLDRGYAGIGLIYELQQRNISFCMRLPAEQWLASREMIAKGQTDKIVTFELPKKEHALLKKYHSDVTEITCRLLVIDLGEGCQEVLCTSLIDADKYKYDYFKELYHYRWGVEEGYKLFKCRASAEVFSGKTALAAKQDFFATIFMITMCSILSFPIEQKVKAEYNAAVHKYKKKINRTDALSIVKETWIGMFIKKKIGTVFKTIDAILIRTSDIVRPNRKFERKKRLKNPPSMNYKQL